MKENTFWLGQMDINILDDLVSISAIHKDHEVTTEFFFWVH